MPESLYRRRMRSKFRRVMRLQVSNAQRLGLLRVATAAMAVVAVGLPACAMRQVSPGRYVLVPDVSNGQQSASGASPATSAALVSPMPAAAPTVAQPLPAYPPPPAPSSAPPPAPSSAPPPAPSNATPPRWVKQLPPATAVMSAVQGDNRADTVARQDAALEVMKFYINVQYSNAHQAVAPLATERMNEYLRAQTRPSTDREPILSPAAQEYYQSPTFHLQVLSKLVLPESLAAYQGSAQYKQMVEIDRQSAQQRAVLESLKKDVHDADKSHVDMTVFGIALGKPLAVPPCEDTMAPTRTCRPIPRPTTSPRAALNTGHESAASKAFTNMVGTMLNDAFDQLEKSRSGITGDVEITSVPVATVNVHIDKSDRPDWLPTESVEVSTIYGYVARIKFGPLAPMFDTKLESTLTTKYKQKPATQDSFACVNEGTVVGRFSTRTWMMPGLRTSYVPSSNPLTVCGTFEARFETITYRHLKEEALAAHEAAQPKL